MLCGFCFVFLRVCDGFVNLHKWQQDQACDEEEDQRKNGVTQISKHLICETTRVSQRLEFEGHLRGKNGIIGTLMDLVMG